MSRFIREEDVYRLVEPTGVARVHCSQIDTLPRVEVKEKMKRYWFRVIVNKAENLVVKVLVQAPNLEKAKELMRDAIYTYYLYTEIDILNVQVELEDDICYAVIGEGPTTHYTTLFSKEENI